MTTKIKEKSLEYRKGIEDCVKVMKSMFGKMTTGGTFVHKADTTNKISRLINEDIESVIEDIED